MKKFVFISDGNALSTTTFNFIHWLHEQEAFLLTGAFFNDINYGLLIPSAFASSADPYLEVTRGEKEKFEATIHRFETLCTKHHIEHRIHRESEHWDKNDLVKESRFTDLIIVSGQHFFATPPNNSNHLLSEVLSSAECPVLVVPDEAKPIKKVAFGYDGNKDSMYALKMFCNVFPTLTALPVDIDYFVSKTDDEIPDLDYLEEFVGRHFTNANFRERYFDPRTYLSTWLKGHNDTMYICGSYHRSALSNMFKKSFAEDIIKEHAATVFIAHTK